MNFIGQNNYTIPKFIEEAKKYGITRRVAPLLLRGMSWGDMVLCVQPEPGIEPFSAFIEFPITKLVGISEEAQKRLAEEFEVQLTIEAPEEPVVERECGSYEQGASYSIDTSLSAIAHRLKELSKEIDIGKIMVGCYPEEVIYIPEPYPRIRNLKRFRGFRSINRDKFWEAVAEEDRKIRAGEYKKRKNPLVSGTFYKSNEVTEESPGIVQEVKNYQKREGSVISEEQLEKEAKKKETQKLEIVRLEQLLEKRETAISRYETAIDNLLSRQDKKIERLAEMVEKLKEGTQLFRDKVTEQQAAYRKAIERHVKTTIDLEKVRKEMK